MSGRIITMLGFSTLCGLLAAWFASNWLTDVASSTREAERIEMATVLVAARDIPFGATFDQSMIRVIEMPAAQVPGNAVTTKENALGKYALRPFLEGELLVTARVGDSLAAGLLAARIGPGKRAVSVRVDAVTGVAGFVMPGDRVDVLSIRSDSRSAAALRSDMILLNMRVLAVDQATANEAGRPSLMNTVTFEATPAEAETLALADRMGTLQLILRNPGEMVQSPPPRQQLKILRGTEQDVIDIPRAVQGYSDNALLSLQ